MVYGSRIISLPGVDMANSQDPAILQALIDDMAQLLRRAFADGYRHGTNEAIDRMTRAATFGADARLPALAGMTNSQKKEAPQRMSPPRVGLPGSPRAYRYGSVIGLFRQALLAAPGTGLTKEDFIEFCRDRGTEITAYQCKDVIKRLIGNEECERHGGLCYAGRRLRPFVDAVQGPPVNGQLPLGDGDAH